MKFYLNTKSNKFNSSIFIFLRVATKGQIKHAIKCTGKIMVVMKCLLLTILFLMRYLISLFVVRLNTFKDPETEETVIVKWSDLIQIYKLENEANLS